MSEEITSRSDLIIRDILIEVNFQDKLVVKNSRSAVAINDDAWNEVVIPELTPNWHDAGKDELEFFLYYSDGTYLCQKKRLKVDFTTGSKYWKTYQYADATSEEAERVYNMFDGFSKIQKFERRTKWIEESKKLFDRQLYYESKWRKIRMQINSMLLYSDWRMLADYQEEFAGEQELWKIWRQRLRGLLPDLETFENNYEAFKYVSLLKYPVDPNVYRELYPEGKSESGEDVAYLTTEDQYVKLDFQASTDFVAANIENISDFVNNHVQEEIYVTKKVYDMLNELNAWNYFPELQQQLVKIAPEATPEYEVEPIDPDTW